MNVELMTGVWTVYMLEKGSSFGVTDDWKVVYLISCVNVRIGCWDYGNVLMFRSFVCYGVFSVMV